SYFHRTGRKGCVAFHALGDGALDHAGRPHDRLQVIGVLGTSQLFEELLVVTIGKSEQVADSLGEEAVLIDIVIDLLEGAGHRMLVSFEARDLIEWSPFHLKV